MAIILNKETIAKRNLDQQASIRSALYQGDAKQNSRAVSPEKIKESVISMGSEKWENSAGYFEHWNKIEDACKKFQRQNVANFPDDYYSLIDLIREDITRKRLQEADYTGMISKEITNEAFSEAVRLLEFLPYAAPFAEYGGNNDSVQLIEQKTGDDDTVVMKNYAVGWKDSLMNMLYNTDIHNLQKVTDAVVRGHTGLRNDLSIGQLPAKTTAAGWDSDQQVAADTTGQTAEDKLYITLNSAVETLQGLYDFQTRQVIPLNKIVIACNNTDVRRVNRAINGQLNNSKDLTSNRTALTEIAEIWPYVGDTIYWGKKTITYPGIAKNKAYMFIPGSSDAPAWTLVKRQLTQEIGRGSVLQLSTEERAWYFVQSRYYDEWFGTSSSNSKITADTSQTWGYVVEVTLPAA